MIESRRLESMTTDFQCFIIRQWIFVLIFRSHLVNFSVTCFNVDVITYWVILYSFLILSCSKMNHICILYVFNKVFFFCSSLSSILLPTPVPLPIILLPYCPFSSHSWDICLFFRFAYISPLRSDESGTTKSHNCIHFLSHVWIYLLILFYFLNMHALSACVVKKREFTEFSFVIYFLHATYSNQMLSL